VSFESLRNEKTEGVVKSVYPRENQFIVRIELGAWPMGVLPGMTADVAILVGRRTNVLMIPLRSLLAGQVFRLREGKKEKISAKLGVLDGEWGEVISDNISETDELLIRK
jgi:macrolide-specific efflux system membrane fusion protein